VFLLFLAVAGLMGLAACGSFFSSCHMCPPVAKPQHFVFTANAGGNQSTVSSLSASPSTGQLTAVSGSPYNAGSGSMAIAASMTGGHLYTANSLSGDISAFTIDLNTGKLNHPVNSPFAVEIGVDAIAIDPNAGFLYAVSGNSAKLWTFSIDASGGLTLVGAGPMLIAAGTVHSTSVVIDPSGKYLYTTTGDSNSASLYGFLRNNSTGVLTQLGGFPVPVAGTSNHSRFDLSGQFLLVTGNNVFNTSGGVDVFTLTAATGGLSLASGPTQVGVDPAGIAVDSSGKYVYVPNTADVNISAFALDGATGALAAVTNSPFPSGGSGNINGPLGIAASNSGPFVYVCNASNDLSVFSVNAGTGQLSPIQGSPFPDGGSNPSAIVFVP